MTITAADLFDLDKGEELLDEISKDSPNHKQVAAMIGDGYPLDQCDKDGCNALSWAAFKGYADHVKLIIARNTDLNFPDRDGRTPLMWAAGHGRFDVVKLLVAAGAKVDLEDKEGRTAARRSMAKGCTDITAFLVEAGANPPPFDASVELKEPVAVCRRPLAIRKPGF